MRTTVTLDDDVAAKLKERSLRSGESFKRVLNEALRIGLSVSRTMKRRPLSLEARPLHLRPGMALDSVAALLEQVDGPDHR
ncbi:MAG: DUF2191 domain-containing protein [Planctomycetes bacterium]|nr:DUF2191 domain-containing protein [Planctomycetota bacterium]